MILAALAPLLVGGGLALGGPNAQRRATEAVPAAATPLHLPWREAGLSERQAAAFLLERVTYGPRPGEVDRVVAMGVDQWLARQLAADLPEPDLDARLAGYGALSLTFDQTFSTYPPPGLVLRQAREAGMIPADFDPQSLRAPEAEPGSAAGGSEAAAGDGSEMTAGADSEMSDGGDVPAAHGCAATSSASPSSAATTASATWWRSSRARSWSARSTPRTSSPS